MANEHPAKKRKYDGDFEATSEQPGSSVTSTFTHIGLPIRSSPSCGTAHNPNTSRTHLASSIDDDYCDDCGYELDLYDQAPGNSRCKSCSQDPRTCEKFISLIDRLSETQDGFHTSRAQLAGSRIQLESTSSHLEHSESALTAALKEKEGLDRKLRRRNAKIAKFGKQNEEIDLLRMQLAKAKVETAIKSHPKEKLRGPQGLFFQTRIYVNNKWLGREHMFPVRNTYHKLRKTIGGLYAQALKGAGLTMRNLIGFNCENLNSLGMEILISDSDTYSAWYKASLRKVGNFPVHIVEALFETDDPSLRNLFVHKIDEPSIGKLVAPNKDYCSEGTRSDDEEVAVGHGWYNEELSEVIPSTDEEDENDAEDDF